MVKNWINYCQIWHGINTLLPAYLLTTSARCGKMNIMRPALFIFFLCILTACEAGTQAAHEGAAVTTLRAIVQKRDAETVWTLDFPKSTAQNAQGGTIALSPENFAVASVKVTGNSIYPELPGFGSLNTANLNAEQRSLINTFCAAVIAGNVAEASKSFHAATRFLFTLFFEDIKDSKLKSFIVGKPAIIDSTWQIPVRFLAGDSHLDIQIYLLYENNWVIDQIAYGELTNG
jgi:hypothetical protein